MSYQKRAPVATRNSLIIITLARSAVFSGKAHAKTSFSTGFFASLWRTDLTDSGVFLILRCLSGIFLPCSVVGRISSVPEHSTTEWDRRAAGMGRQPRKAE